MLENIYDCKAFITVPGTVYLLPSINIKYEINSNK